MSGKRGTIIFSIIKQWLEPFRRQKHRLVEPTYIIPRSAHTISRDDISENALKVLRRLKHKGFAAHLVGGSVRDLLLHKTPKDFDVATDAKPEQIRALFRNCRLIGRRFRLAHILFGREIIEVATFRREAKRVSKKKQHHSGMILSDNIYGTIGEDALRRDFTVNALYYNITDFSVIDYTTGLEDLKNKTLRLIGDPQERYREDPVRMLRAIRFAAKLDLSIHPDTEAPIIPMRDALDHISPDRLFEESVKLFHSGSSLKAFELLRHYGIFEKLFPQAEKHLHDNTALALLKAAFSNTDLRIHEDRPVNPAFLFSVLLWHAMEALSEQLREEGHPPLEAMEIAMRRVLNQQRTHTNIPKRFAQTIFEIWIFQYRLPRRHGNRAFSTLEHPRFRAAFDFLLLREQAGETEPGLGEWWEHFQVAARDDQEAMIQALKTPQQKPRKRRAQRKNV